MEDDGTRRQKNRTCEKLNIEAVTEDPVVDILSHVRESDAVEPGSCTSVDDDLGADEKSSDKEKPSTSIETKATHLPVFHDQQNDADEWGSNGKHRGQLNDEKPYWSLHEFSGVVKSTLD